MKETTPASTKRDRAARYRSLRVIFESPILDEHKFAKLPSIPADMFFLDLEDSAPPARKVEARQRVVEYVKDPSYFGGRLTVARPNHLDTPWGHDDVVALAKAGVTCVAYPKLTSVEDLYRVISLFEANGASPDIFAIIETAGAVMDLREIAKVPNVVLLMSGPGDLSVDMGVTLLRDDGTLNPLMAIAKALISLAASANGLASSDIIFAPDYRDFDDIRRRTEVSHQLGFTAMASFYPPHVDIINEVLTPSEEQVARAREMVAAYEAVLAEGRGAALTSGGETILVHDYDKAKGVLAKSALLSKP